MLLFFCSILLVCGCAFFTANLLASRNVINNIIYFFLIAFANVVFTFEILSLFSKISDVWVLFINLLLFITALLVWRLKSGSIVRINYGKAIRGMLSAFRKDKLLAVLSVGFIFMILTSVFLVVLLPASEASDVSYHVLRALFWIENGNLNHFNIADARALAFPINSEILYMWVMIFLKRDAGLCGFSFAAFVLYLVSLYGILSKFTVSLRRKFWVIFVVSSFTAVITYLSSTETNIMIAALVTAALYLLIDNLKSQSFCGLFMSALAAAIAIGVKNSAFFILPAVMLWFLIVGFHNKFKNTGKNFLLWLGLLFINFLIFSSYNFILNFINYGDFVSIPSLMQSHKNLFGLKGFLFNSVNYFIMLFKFSELDGICNFSDFTLNILKSLIKFFDQPFLIGRYTNDNTFRIISADRSGLGINGILVFLPCLLIAIKGFFSNKANKRFLLDSFAIIFFISFIIMAYSVVYMSFNVRFIVTFAMISAPVVYFSYSKKFNIYKLLVFLAAISSLIYIPLNITHNKALHLINYFRQDYSVSKIREAIRCSSVSENINVYCSIRNYIAGFDKKNKFLYFSQETDGLLPIKLLQFKNYTIDVDLIENLANIDLNKYNVVILLGNRQVSTLFNNLNMLDYGVYRGQGFYCIYNDVNGNMVFNTDSSRPYLSNCTVQDEFWHKRRFRLLDIMIFPESMDGTDRYFTYYIYENINNPVIK